MSLWEWIRVRGGIVHRSDALEAGFTARALRAQTDGVGVRRIRRYWLATMAAPPPLVAAAQASGRLACVSLARYRNWWMPDDVDVRTHLSVGPNGAVPADKACVLHWNTPIVPHRPRTLPDAFRKNRRECCGNQRSRPRSSPPMRSAG